MERLRRARGSIKRSLTTFSTYLDAFTDKPTLADREIIEIETRLSVVLPALDSYNVKHELIIDLISEEDPDHVFESEELKKQEFENLYFSQVARAKVFLTRTTPSPTMSPSIGMPASSHMPFAPSAPSASTASSAASGSGASQPGATNVQLKQIQLPKINLPTFSGAPDCWLEFRDKYVSLIHTNTDIGDMQRYHYLRACLSGEASMVIHGVEFSLENYTGAWEMLCTRYDNPRVLMHNHIKALFNIEPLQRESATKLRAMLDNLVKHIGALNRLNKNSSTDLFSVLITFVVTSKFDAITARDWEESQQANKLPTMESLKIFIRDKADLLSTLDIKNACERTQNINIHKHSSKPKHFISKQNINSHIVQDSYSLKCALCKREHILRNCPDLLQLSPTDRYTKIKSMNRCINCLRFGHQLDNCSSSLCRKCGKKHHTLLHFENPASNAPHSNEFIESTSSHLVKSNTSTFLSRQMPYVLLSTALVNVVGALGTTITARVLLDGGSQSNFITDAFAVRLGLSLSPVDITVSGFSLATSSIKFSCQAKITSLHSNFEMSTKFLVTPCITQQIPGVRIDTSSIKLPSNIVLADPSYGEPGPIDMLLGAEHFLSLLCIGQISLGRGKPTIQKSKLGWLLSGMAAGGTTPVVSCNFSQSLSDSLTRFWEVEEIPSSLQLSPDVHPCEQLFQQTVKQNAEGRFVVTIPTVNLDQLADTREIALRRFSNTERALNRRPEIRKKYVHFMDEYLALGHMSPSVPTEHPVYYLPHHSVMRESSTTTKLRVVFDGSAKPPFGKSLNDCQMVGPCVQDDLFSILLRFRKHSVVFTADIEKMYRQIFVCPEQRSLQRIFWRSNMQEPIQSFDLNTITYGTASASYLATRCLTEVANSIESFEPSVANCIRHDFYVDDLLSGADTIEQAIKLINGINTAFDRACLPLRKWNSNKADVLQGSQNAALSDIDFASFDNVTSTTLGLVWHSKLDILKYRINVANEKPISKRAILSHISEIFDPLGLLSPCVMVAKLIIQTLWSQGIDWDESLPSSIFQEWISFRNSLKVLNSLVIPRYALCANCVSVELHGFSDASVKAYGAALYLRCTDALGNTACTLLCAKGRVAPLKTLTIPRLELCGAHLLANLFHKISKILHLAFLSVTFWCDSTIVLAWINQCPSTLRTFVGNRISQIQTRTKGHEWRHVPTSDNPADFISRGLTPSALLNASCWWHGPKWLSDSHSRWPPNIVETVDILELRPNAAVSLLTGIALKHPVDATKFSSFSRLVRVTSFVLRFLHNVRNPSKRAFGFISLAERQLSIVSLIRAEQRICFSKEFLVLSKDDPAKGTTKFQPLAPFVNAHGLLRVRGRLNNSNQAYSGKHPILLPNANHLVKLLFQHEHIRLFHVGPQGLLNALRQKYWPLAGRNLARKVVFECVRCFRAKPRSPAPEMGQLPVARVNPSPPFYHCGVDYAGPFVLKTLPGRGCKTYKAYIALFVCLSTRAVHLELVTDLTTQAFIAALRRFSARRGKPAVVHSDNGTNFIGARRELDELGKFLRDVAPSLEEAVDSEGITWKFIPARSPHFGGIWEAGVKSVKYHMKRVVGAQLLTYEDFYTFLVQIEAILNSRPLVPFSSDPNDISPITPAHFLVGRPLACLPDEDFSDAVLSSCLRYKHAQAMSQHFWKRWSREYLNTLQQRARWNKPTAQTDIRIGTVVLLIDDASPPMHWRMGRIVDVHPGSDGIIRVVSVKTTNGVVKRALRRICPLPHQQDDSPLPLTPSTNTSDLTQQLAGSSSCLPATAFSL